MSEIVEKAKKFAKEYHDKAGQIGYFEEHICRVHDILQDFLMYHEDDYWMTSYLWERYQSEESISDIRKGISSYEEFANEINEDTRASAYLHDVLEDCKDVGVSFELIEKEFGYDISHIVYCLTDSEGKTRKERKLKSYHKIRSCFDAVAVKLCDRIANLERSSKDKNSKYYKMYQDEYYTFKAALWEGEHTTFQVLWNRLDELHEFKI